MKRTLLQALGIILISGALGLGINGFRAEGIPVIEDWSEKILNEELAAGFPAVSLAQARRAYARGEAVFVDARDPDFYRLVHIPGALSLPARDFEQVFPQLRDRLLAAPRLIAYCDGASCEMSVELAEKLFLAGLDEVAIFTGGIQQWEGAGLPVESASTEQVVK